MKIRKNKLLYALNERLSTMKVDKADTMAKMVRVTEMLNNDFNYQVKRYLLNACKYKSVSYNEDGPYGLRRSRPKTTYKCDYDKFLILYTKLLKKYATKMKPRGVLKSNFSKYVCIIEDEGNPMRPIFFTHGSKNPDDNKDIVGELNSLADDNFGGCERFINYMYIIFNHCVPETANKRKLVYELRRIADIPHDRNEAKNYGATLVKDDEIYDI